MVKLDAKSEMPDAKSFMSQTTVAHAALPSDVQQAAFTTDVSPATDAQANWQTISATAVPLKGMTALILLNTRRRPACPRLIFRTLGTGIVAQQKVEALTCKQTRADATLILGNPLLLRQLHVVDASGTEDHDEKYGQEKYDHRHRKLRR